MAARAQNCLNYNVSKVQGECTLKSVTPVYRCQALFMLYVSSSVLLIGVPLLITFWYPWLKRVIYFRPCSLEDATHFHVVNYDQISTYPEKKIKLFYKTSSDFQQIVQFENRYLTYLVENNTVKAAQFDFIKRLKEIISHQNPEKKSYTPGKDVDNLRQSYGQGDMIIDMPLPKLFLQEIMRPLYLFVLYSCSLWIYQKYYYYSGVIFFTAAIGILINLYQVYRNNEDIIKMVKNEEAIQTLRGGEICNLPSKQLVPGDIVFVKRKLKLPFDGIILEGEVLVNQSALRGLFSEKLKKSEVVLDEFNESQLKDSFIQEGTFLTNILNDKAMLKFEHYRKQHGVPLLVARTNFSSTKGQLVRVIIFPREKQNVFERQSAKFLIFLFCLSAISYLVLIVKLKDQLPVNKLVEKFFDLITITVPPGLSVSTTFSIIFALQKLQNKKILCSSPNKIIHGGLTNWLCFDKTGTLTENFMAFNCLVFFDGQKFSDPIYNHRIRNTTIAQEQTSAQLEQILKNNKNIHLALNNMAMNHKIQPKEKLANGPMEINLFQFGEFKAFDTKRGHKGTVYQRFDFDQHLFRESVIGKSSTTGDDYYLYTKGSPEMMLEVFDRSPPFPTTYGKVLKQYASQGFKVYAIGSKKITEDTLKSSRKELENNINFEGFLIFENALKPQTKEAIKIFRECDLSCVMITGDNSLTASNIACQCLISDPTKITLICNYRNNQLSMEQFQYRPKNSQEELVPLKQIPIPIHDVDLQENIDKPTNQQIQHSFMGETFQRLIEDSENYKILITQRLRNKNIQLCLTGPALDKIFLNKDKNALTCHQKQILLKTKVFAVSKPKDKIKVISLYQKMGLRVGMCGDGVNDCGALRQADLGLSLSAQAPSAFSSQVSNISSMVELVKECRAVFATNFSLFNIMALYSLTQYTTTLISEFYFSYPWDFQFLYWDIFCNFLFFLPYGYTGTVERLSPLIPRGSLFTLSNLTQVLIVFGLQLTGQILMIVGLAQIFNDKMDYSPNNAYERFLENNKDFVLESPQNNVLFLYSNIMYIATLLAFTISQPWRKEFYTNPLFMFVLVLILPYSIIMMVVPDARLEIFQIRSLKHDQGFYWYIFGLAIGIGTTIVVAQKCILEPLFRFLKVKYPEKTWL